MKVHYITQPNFPTPKVIMSEIAYHKMFAAAFSTETKGYEIAWIGTVEKQSEYTYYIKDIFFFPQKNKYSTVEDDEAKYGPWFHTNFPTIEDKKQVRFHGHLHPGKSTSPSTTDENLFKEMLTRVKDFFIRIIISKDYNFTLDIFDKEHNLIFKDVNLFVDDIEIKPSGLASFPEFNLNGAYTIKNNLLTFLTNKIHLYEYDLKNNTKVLRTKLLTLTDKLRINSVPESIDKQLKEAMTPITTYTYEPKTINSEVISAEEYLLDDELSDALNKNASQLTDHEINLLLEEGYADEIEIEAAKYYDASIMEVDDEMYDLYLFRKDKAII